MVAVATEDCAVVDSPYWLHAGCRIVRVVSVGGGRGVVASEAIEPGALVLEEPAYLIAESYEAMLDRLQEISDDPVIRDMHPVGTGVERLPDVIAHNWHKPDPEIVEGEVGASVRRERGDFGPLGGTTAAGGSRTVKKLPGGSILGLWPKGSLINHKFGRPNLARSFVVKEEPGPEGSWHEVLYVQYRCIRTVCAGEELLDNYMDLLSPFSRRLEVERNQHGMMCRPDELDHPRTPEWLQRASAGLEASSPADAVSLLAPVCREFMPGGEEARDPALWPPIFELGRALQALRLWPQALGVYAHALKLVMAREPFSVCTCRTLAVLCGCYCARLKAWDGSRRALHRYPLPARCQQAATGCSRNARSVGQNRRGRSAVCVHRRCYRAAWGILVLVPRSPWPTAAREDARRASGAASYEGPFRCRPQPAVR